MRIILSDVPLTESSFYDQKKNYLVIQRVNEDTKRAACKKLCESNQLSIRFTEGTTIFSMVMRANVTRGGIGGGTLDRGSPFRLVPATDIVKLGTTSGATRFGVQNKIITSFTGYLLDPDGKSIAYVSALVKLMPPVVNKVTGWIERVYEELAEGPVTEVTRWAHISDIWSDEAYSYKFWKYLMIHSVPGKWWKEEYKRFWDGKNDAPDALVKWNVHEDL